MKAVKVFLILLATVFAIIWIRGGEGFDLRRVLPLVNEKPGLYQGGGIAMLALLIWGLSRLRNPYSDDRETHPSETSDPSYSPDDSDD